MLPQPTIARRPRSMTLGAPSRFNTTRARAGSSVASELDREGLQPAEREALTILGLVVDQLEPREPAHERVDRDLPFQARERRAQAKVDAPAEGEGAGGASPGVPGAGAAARARRSRSALPGARAARPGKSGCPSRRRCGGCRLA